MFRIEICCNGHLNPSFILEEKTFYITFFILEKKDLVELIMKESPYYGSTSANESSTKDNTRTTTQNSNNSNSRSTRYLSYSHNVTDRNLFITSS